MISDNSDRHEYRVAFTLIDSKGIRSQNTESVFLFNSTAADTAKRKIENKYRGQGYKVRITSASFIN